MLVYGSEFVNTGLTKKVEGFQSRADNKTTIVSSEINISKTA